MITDRDLPEVENESRTSPEMEAFEGLGTNLVPFVKHLKGCLH